MIRISQLKISLAKYKTHQEYSMLMDLAVRKLRIRKEQIDALCIVKRSLDARHKENIHYLYSIDVTLKGIPQESLVARLKDPQVQIAKETVYHFPPAISLNRMQRISVIGSGPAGLFCALYLARAGYQVDIYERGGPVEERTHKVDTFWHTGVLDEECNVQFGEGGAGTFSDGKLNTGIKDPSGRIKAVLRTFVEFGANPSILYDAKPHIGTDVLSRVVVGMRQEIIRLGGRVHFHQKFVGVETKQGVLTGIRLESGECVDTDACVLAIGHSARDTFIQLANAGVAMQSKSFAIGLRLEHAQTLIDANMYHREDRGCFPAADYKVTGKGLTGRSVFSFCMCPGGYVVNASSEAQMTCTNGMSYAARDGQNANSAIIVSVNPEDTGSKDVLSGMYFQRKLEGLAYQTGRGAIPVQLNEDFMKGIVTKELGTVTPQIKGRYAFGNFREILPEWMSETIACGMESFDKMIKGFHQPDAVFSGVESRTSSPVRILRDEKLNSICIQGLYPCGEGAGYAGGITSAAVDGIKVAEAIASLV